MARPKRKQGFRPVVVDGIRYRWRFDEPNRTADLEIYLESESSARGQRLCVNFRNDGTPLHGTPFPLTGRAAATAIRMALERGWQPRTATGDFRLDLNWPTVN
jgi:hypothetical protein